MNRRVRRVGPSIAAATLAVLVLAALFARWLSPYDPLAQQALDTFVWQAPSAAHPLGTDSAARDVLSRLLFGARATLGIAALAVLVSITLGTLVGATAAVARGAVDAVLMRVTDAFLAVPRLLLLLLVVASLGHPNEVVLAVILGSTGWMTTSRLVRQETRRLLATDHVRGARALGVPTLRLVRRHLLPALGPTLAVAATFAFAAAVPLEAGLSYLGLGVATPAPSWGNILADADARRLQTWWLVLYPTLAIALTVIAANGVAEAFGRGARDGLDDATRDDAMSDDAMSDDATRDAAIRPEGAAR